MYCSIVYSEPSLCRAVLRLRIGAARMAVIETSGLYSPGRVLPSHACSWGRRYLLSTLTRLSALAVTYVRDPGIRVLTSIQAMCDRSNTSTNSADERQSERQYKDKQPQHQQTSCLQYPSCSSSDATKERNMKPQISCTDNHKHSNASLA